MSCKGRKEGEREKEQKDGLFGEEVVRLCYKGNVGGKWLPLWSSFPIRWVGQSWSM